MHDPLNELSSAIWLALLNSYYRVLVAIKTEWDFLTFEPNQ